MIGATEALRSYIDARKQGIEARRLWGAKRLIPAMIEFHQAAPKAENALRYPSEFTDAQRAKIGELTVSLYLWAGDYEDVGRVGSQILEEVCQNRFPNRRNRITFMMETALNPAESDRRYMACIPLS